MTSPPARPERSRGAPARPPAFRLRIIAGAWRGRPLLSPPGLATRPTADRTREGLFSMLQSRLGSFEGLHVADLFAGTGALGLEALSRGAAFCTFVETDRAALDAIRTNLARLGAAPQADIRAGAAEHARPSAQPCHLVLIDPPYAADLAHRILARLADPLWLAPGALVSVEAERPLAAPSGFEPETDRRFGKAHITLLRYTG